MVVCMNFFDTDFLRNKEIFLKLKHTSPANPVKNWVPAYHFDICKADGQKVGSCDLRIGYTEGLYYGGHIGYRVDEGFRGNHYAAKACRLLFSLAKMHKMKYLYITCSPDNIASKKTCEYLGGRLLEIAELPEDNDMRINLGETRKCVFRYDL